AASLASSAAAAAAAVVGAEVATAAASAASCAAAAASSAAFCAAVAAVSAASAAAAASSSSSGVPQSDRVIVSLMSVTAPVPAMSLPRMSAPESTLIDAAASTVPVNAELAPSVAELPTFQNTLHACAP